MKRREPQRNHSALKGPYLRISLRLASTIFASCDLDANKPKEVGGPIATAEGRAVSGSSDRRKVWVPSRTTRWCFLSAVIARLTLGLGFPEPDNRPTRDFCRALDHFVDAAEHFEEGAGLSVNPGNQACCGLVENLEGAHLRPGRKTLQPRRQQEGQVLRRHFLRYPHTDRLL